MSTTAAITDDTLIIRSTNQPAGRREWPGEVHVPLVSESYASLQVRYANQPYSNVIHVYPGDYPTITSAQDGAVYFQSRAGHQPHILVRPNDQDETFICAVPSIAAASSGAQTSEYELKRGRAVRFRVLKDGSINTWDRKRVSSRTFTFDPRRFEGKELAC